LHTAAAAQSFPLENKQAGIHSRAMSKQMEQLPARMSCEAKRKARCASRQLQKAVPDTQQNIQSDSIFTAHTASSTFILEPVKKERKKERKKEMRLSQSYQQLLVSSFSPPGSSQGRKTQPCKTCFFSKFQSIILPIICTSTSSGERKHSTNLSKHLAGALGQSPAGLLVGCKIPVTSCTCGALADF